MTIIWPNEVAKFLSSFSLEAHRSRFQHEKEVAKKTLEKMSERVNTKFTEKERFFIAKYTAINGLSAAV